MLIQRLLLAIGGLALLAGIVLAFLWLRSPSPSVALPEQPKAAQQAILVANHALAARTLLRSDDMRWQEVTNEQVPQGAFIRGQANEGDFVGAAVSRSYASGDPLLAGTILKPTDPGFLPAVLNPGTRAVSMAVGPAEGGAGLVAPGDHVDVLLTQNFSDSSLTADSRSVAETVIKDLRVIAIDQSVGTIAKSPSGEPSGGPAEPHIPKTVTLETTQYQAEALMVAIQLGKVELALRSLAADDTTGQATATPGTAGTAAAPGKGGPQPTWAYDVSPALRELGNGPPGKGGRGNAAGAQSATASAPKAERVVEIFRGGRSELRCFDARGTPVPSCGLPEAVAQPAAQTAGAAAVAPAPAEAAPPAPSRRPAPKR